MSISNNEIYTYFYLRNISLPIEQRRASYLVTNISTRITNNNKSAVDLGTLSYFVKLDLIETQNC